MKTKPQNHQTKSNKKTGSGLENRNDKINTEPKAESIPDQIDFELRKTNRSLPKETLLQVLQEQAPTFYQQAQIVGKWVWIQFAEKQPREVTRILAQLGFHWNNKRQVWQHPCGSFTLKPASYDPRERYGSQSPAQQAA